MSNPFKVLAETTGLNVQGNEILMPPGALAVADNVSYDRDDIIGMRFGFDKCANFLPVAKPESMFSKADNLFVHINSKLYYLKYPDLCSYEVINGESTVAISEPVGIAISGYNIYLTEYGDVVRRINASDNSVVTICGLFGTSGSADGVGSIARFNNPSGIWSNATYAYVCDRSNFTIRRIELATNTVTTIAGTAGVSGSADGIGAAARFNQPFGIWGNSTYLYITDYSNFTIRRLEIATNNVVTIAGAAGASGSTDGVGAAARFDGPIGITGDSTYLYICDTNNVVIRRLEIATNTVTTIAGVAGSVGSADGIGSAARFSNPFFIDKDADYLWITDRLLNQRIRRLQISNNNVTTVAGSVLGDVDGTGTSAQFNFPTGIVGDSLYLYVCDYANKKIRRINKIAFEVITYAGYAASIGSTDGYLLSVINGPNG